MRSKASFFFILVTCPLLGAPVRESAPLQEIRLALEQMEYQVHSHTTEIDLFQERLHNLEQSLASFKQELKKGEGGEKSSERRLIALEKAHEALIEDFKTLKNALTACQTKINKVDQQLTSDLQSLKNSLQSMLALLQKHPPPERGKSYIVKPGDSLGQIALNHKTSIQTLKELNRLNSDTIYVGQKIILP